MHTLSYNLKFCDAHWNKVSCEVLAKAGGSLMKHMKQVEGATSPSQLYSWNRNRAPGLWTSWQEFSVFAWKKEIKEGKGGFKDLRFSCTTMKGSRARSLACDTFAGCLIHCSCIGAIHIVCDTYSMIHIVCDTYCVWYRASIVGQTWLSCIRWPVRIRWGVAQSRDRNPVRNCGAHSNRAQTKCALKLCTQMHSNALKCTLKCALKMRSNCAPKCALKLRTQVVEDVEDAAHTDQRFKHEMPCGKDFDIQDDEWPTVSGRGWIFWYFVWRGGFIALAADWKWSWNSILNVVEIYTGD